MNKAKVVIELRGGEVVFEVGDTAELSVENGFLDIAGDERIPLDDGDGYYLVRTFAMFPVGDVLSVRSTAINIDPTEKIQMGLAARVGDRG